MSSVMGAVVYVLCVCSVVVSPCSSVRVGIT